MSKSFGPWLMFQLGCVLYAHCPSLFARCAHCPTPNRFSQPKRYLLWPIICYKMATDNERAQHTNPSSSYQPSSNPLPDGSST
ncbi:hypothetical protein F5878DRAFT_624295 [Lentinula raphanica]|uniref:Secreted protein n=1 Tax=Lentinula raphanica TaxID=153919 RepID=A0AA38P5R0_9AGAR|nr:hypothetical protein F5878DRAFT_624295 [Lentinula raphanica]